MKFAFKRIYSRVLFYKHTIQIDSDGRLLMSKGNLWEECLAPKHYKYRDKMFEHNSSMVWFYNQVLNQSFDLSIQEYGKYKWFVFSKRWK